jgi:hypothetical protein
MNVIAKMLSAALLASLVTVAAPSVSLACDGHDGQAKQEKKKGDTVAQTDRNTEQTNKKKGEQQAPNDKQDRQGKAEGSSGTRTN